MMNIHINPKTTIYSTMDTNGLSQKFSLTSGLITTFSEEDKSFVPPLPDC
jgi:hypothetical protein